MTEILDDHHIITPDSCQLVFSSSTGSQVASRSGMPPRSKTTTSLSILDIRGPQVPTIYTASPYRIETVTAVNLTFEIKVSPYRGQINQPRNTSPSYDITHPGTFARLVSSIEPFDLV